MEPESPNRPHVVLSRQADAAHPGRVTLAWGPSVERLLALESTEDAAEVMAVLRVLADGGTAPHPRIERDWGPRLREAHAGLAAAAVAKPVTGSLAQRLHG